MQNTEILAQVLDLEEEWHVQSYEIDQLSNRIDITVAPGALKRKSFFSLSKRIDDAKTVILRHLPISGMRVFLHVPVEDGADSNKHWAPAGSKLTHAMEAFVISTLNHVQSNQAAAKITGVTVAEVRDVSERTGAGTGNIINALNSVASSNAADSRVNTEQATAHSFELADSHDLPPVTHQNWYRMLAGELSITASPIGLQMLLQRLRQNMAQNSSEITRLDAANSLRQYFIKNRHRHQKDIAIIAGDTRNIVAAATPVARTTGLPAEHHVVWQMMIDGEIQMQTDNVALQMMMARVRQSVKKSSSESSYQAGAAILRQFFLKHERRLVNEIRQITTNTGTIKKDEIKVPAEDAACWQHIIDGVLNIQSNIVGLQMMIEHVRQSVKKNNTQTNRMAGAKILHQYFEKHKASSENEIAQFNDLGATTQPVGRDKIVIPVESHPNWQRLINGELTFNTDIVAFKMMLESVRMSITHNPTQASRLSGAKILRQYFIKHQKKHKTEINQLITA